MIATALGEPNPDSLEELSEALFTALALGDARRIRERSERLRVRLEAQPPSTAPAQLRAAHALGRARRWLEVHPAQHTGAPEGSARRNTVRALEQPFAEAISEDLALRDPDAAALWCWRREGRGVAEPESGGEAAAEKRRPAAAKPPRPLAATASVRERARRLAALATLAAHGVSTGADPAALEVAIRDLLRLRLAGAATVALPLRERVRGAFRRAPLDPRVEAGAVALALEALLRALSVPDGR